MRSPSFLAGLFAVVAALTACHAGQPGTVPTPVVTTSIPSPLTSTSFPSPMVPTASAATPTPTPSAPRPKPKVPMPVVDTHFYGNFTPYPAPATVDASNPGRGYRVVFSESLARHGSRTVTSASDAKRVLCLWQRAENARALTARGRQLAPAVRTLATAMSRLGYGELSTLGLQEQRGLGEREGVRLAGYLSRAAKAHDQVEIVNTGVHRTITSAASFVGGLRQARPGLRVASQRTDRTLHFGTNDARYAKFIAQNRQWRAAYERAVAGNDLRANSVRGLTRLYSPGFVAKISDPVGEARAVWNLYRAQGPMSADLTVSLTPLMDAKTAAAFAFDADASWFYSQGPGITGSTLSYRAANPLLRRFVAAADDRLAGGSTAAVYRFAHDNDLAPFAARLKLAGSRQLKTAREVYSWDDSAFRLAQVAPMAGNIEWTLWRNGAGKVMLQVRQNEVPTTLGGGCTVAIRSGSFYAWGEAKRCLGE